MPFSSNVDGDSSQEPACTAGESFFKLTGQQGLLNTSRIGDFMDGRLTFEQLRQGQSWSSPSRTITETDVVNFANATGDHNPLHTDYEYAKRTHFRQPIAHGLLGLSWVAGLGSNSPSVATVAFTNIRHWEFSRPLYFGDTVYVKTQVVEMQDNPKRAGRVTWRLELINQRGEIAQYGEFQTLVKVGNPVRGHHFNSGTNHSTHNR